jgi:hypothetical protein
LAPRSMVTNPMYAALEEEDEQAAVYVRLFLDRLAEYETELPLLEAKQMFKIRAGLKLIFESIPCKWEPPQIKFPAIHDIDESEARRGLLESCKVLKGFFEGRQLKTSTQSISDHREDPPTKIETVADLQSGKSMSRKKLNALVSGLLTLCLLSLFWTDYGDRVIGLTELVAASGAWACLVWLFPSTLSESRKVTLSKVLGALNSVLVFAGIGLMWISGGFLVLAFLILPGAGSIKPEVWGRLFLASVGFVAGAALYFGWPKVTNVVVDFIRRY